MTEQAAPSIWLLCVALAFVVLLVPPSASFGVGSEEARVWQQRGEAVLAAIDRDLKPADGGMYVEEVKLDDPAFTTAPCFAWAAGIHLSALNGAAALDPAKNTPALKAYTESLKPYWYAHGGISGYTDVPHATEPRRYYDDNEWLVLDFVDSYKITNDESYLSLAKETMKYVLSGEDNVLGGGIYWYEQKKESKNTCSNAPGIVCALELYKVTKDDAYLAAAKRLYAWTQTNLQDADGLYFDNKSIHGKVEKTKWSYNTALMIRSACLMYDVTQDGAYLTEAARVAAAAEKKWFKPDGSFDDTAYFAHLMTESFLELSARDKDPRWSAAVGRATQFVFDHNHDADGRYPERWSRTVDKPVTHVTLKNQASAARAYLRWALFLKEGK